MLQSTISYVKELPEDEFQYLFSRAVGRVSMTAALNPGATCRMDEVAELFESLFDRMQGRKYETPAGGAARESK